MAEPPIKIHASDGRFIGSFSISEARILGESKHNGDEGKSNLLRLRTGHFLLLAGVSSKKRNWVPEVSAREITRDDAVRFIVEHGLIPPSDMTDDYLLRMAEHHMPARARGQRLDGVKPDWSQSEGILRLLGRVICDYRTKSAKNQERLLGEFQAADWGKTIVSELASHTLKETVYSFNKKVTPSTIKLRKAGGEGRVSWTA